MDAAAPKRVLITGCSGFIGRALSLQCIADGWTVRGNVRSPEGQRRLPSGVEAAVVSDLSPETDWSSALKDIDAVVHLAARVHNLKETAADPIAEYYRTNIAGTARLARAAAEAGVKRFVFLSSIKVNGEGREIPYTEEDPESPQDPYAVSKLEAERALQEVAARSGLETVTLRPPLVYGPEVKANFLRLIRMVERRLPLPFASVQNRRSMIFVGNLASAIRACLRIPGAAGKTYLVADGESISTPRLIQEIGTCLGVEPRLFPMPLWVLQAVAALSGKRQDAARLIGSLIVDPSKISRDLKWKPEVPLAEGLKLTIDWYRGRS